MNEERITGNEKMICLVLSLVCIVSMVACEKSDESAPTAAEKLAEAL